MRKFFSIFVLVVLLLVGCNSDGVSNSFKKDAQNVIDIIIESHENEINSTSQEDKEKISSFFDGFDIANYDDEIFDNKEDAIKYYIYGLDIVNRNYILMNESIWKYTDEEIKEKEKRFNFYLEKLNELGMETDS